MMEKGRSFSPFGCLSGLAAGKGICLIVPTVNKNNSLAIRAYEKLGFENLGSIVADIGNGFVIDDYRMEKRIT